MLRVCSVRSAMFGLEDSARVLWRYALHTMPTTLPCFQPFQSWTLPF